MTHTPNVQFIVAFDVLYFIGLLSLALILATALLSPSIQRSSTWYMFISSWIITCITSLILLGQQTGPPPQTGVCLFQAMLIYATPVLSSIYALAFMLQAFMSIRHAIRESWSSSNLSMMQRNMMVIHALPIVTSIAVLIEVLVLGLQQPNTISRINSGMYCHLSTPIPGQISSGITIAAMILFIIIGFWTIIILQRRNLNLRSNIRKDPPGNGLAPDVVMRVLVFSFFPIIGLALSSLHYFAKNGTTANIILAASAYHSTLLSELGVWDSKGYATGLVQGFLPAREEELIMFYILCLVMRNVADRMYERHLPSYRTHLLEWHGHPWTEIAITFYIHNSSCWYIFLYAWIGAQEVIWPANEPRT